MSTNFNQAKMKKQTTILCCAIVGIAIVNVIGFSSLKETDCDLKMQNIETLSAAVVEGWCDGATEAVCKITVDGVEGQGTGQPHIEAKF